MALLPTHKKVYIQNIGLIDYKEALEIQNKFFNKIIQIKLANRKLHRNKQQVTPNYLLFCEHPPTYTLGSTGSLANLLVKEATLASQQIAFYPINRGGDITYHGPGQIVVYPILDLENFFTDLHQYLRTLEEAVINTLAVLGLDGGRIPKLTGVWIDCQNPPKAKKICALGIRVSRWVTMHGLALNVHPDLSYFQNIIPCGIQGKRVTSIFQELGEKQSLQNVAQLLQENILSLFAMERGKIR